jgi:plastocyanin
MRKRFAQCAVAVALQIAVVSALAKATPALGTETTVKIENFAFSPQRLTVKPGTTIVWENADDIPHTVVSTTKAFRSQALDTGDKFSFTFTSPGTHDYFCSLHPHMTGTIVVDASSSGNTASAH